MKTGDQHDQYDQISMDMNMLGALEVKADRNRGWWTVELCCDDGLVDLRYLVRGKARTFTEALKKAIAMGKRQ
jgi:hypothetical protein